MPNIPFLQTPTDVAKPNAAVLINERGPDLGGMEKVVEQMGRLGKAGALPLADPAPFIAAAGARGLAIGEALAKTGDMASALALKEQHAIDDRKNQEAYADMQMAHDDFRTYQETHPDASTWGAAAQKIFGGVVKKYEGIKGVSHLGRAALQTQLNAGYREAMNHADNSAKLQNFDLTRKAYLNRSEIAFRKGDFDGARNGIMEGVAAHYIHESEGRINLDAINRGERDQKRENDIATVPVNVKGWLKEPEKHPDMPEQWKEVSASESRRYLSEAEKSHLGQKGAYLNDLKGAVGRGEVKNMHEFMEWHKHQTQGIMDPGDRETVRAIIHDTYPDMGAINALSNKAKNFDPTAPDADVKAAQLEYEFAQQPAKYESMLKDQLSAVRQAGDPGPSALAFGREALHRMHEEERFTDDKGNPLAYKQDRFLAGSRDEPGALDDFNKVKVFGITEAETKELNKLEGKGKILRFRELVRAHNKIDDGRSSYDKSVKPEIQDADAWNKLTPFTQGLFMSAMHGGDFVDPAVRDQSAAVERKFVTELEKWHASHPHETADGVLKWIHNNTSKERRMRSFAIIHPDPAPRDAAGAGSQPWNTLNDRLP